MKNAILTGDWNNSLFSIIGHDDAMEGEKRTVLVERHHHWKHAPIAGNDMTPVQAKEGRVLWRRTIAPGKRKKALYIVLSSQIRLEAVSLVHGRERLQEQRRVRRDCSSSCVSPDAAKCDRKHWQVNCNFVFLFHDFPYLRPSDAWPVKDNTSLLMCSELLFMGKRFACFWPIFLDTETHRYAGKNNWTAKDRKKQGCAVWSFFRNDEKHFLKGYICRLKKLTYSFEHSESVP